MHKKLPLLKALIKKWNIESFRSISNNIQKFEGELTLLDRLADDRDLIEVELDIFCALK